MTIDPTKIVLRGILLSGLILLSARVQATEPSAPDGARIYDQHRCSVCHGGHGGGGFGPRLAGDPMLAIDQYVAAQILIGRGKMPAYARELSDEEISAVSEHIRNSWGNHFGPLGADLVAETRKLMEKAAPQSVERR
jgi:mono/diheme cytochrome c family protein